MRYCYVIQDGGTIIGGHNGTRDMSRQANAEGRSSQVLSYGSTRVKDTSGNGETKHLTVLIFLIRLLDPVSFGSWVSEHNLYAFSSFIEYWHLPITVSGVSALPVRQYQRLNLKGKRVSLFRTTNCNPKNGS